jgi:hypothetical protein
MRKRNKKFSSDRSREAEFRARFLCVFMRSAVLLFDASSSLRSNDCGAHSKFNPMMILNNDENGEKKRRRKNVHNFFNKTLLIAAKEFLVSGGWRV